MAGSAIDALFLGVIEGLTEFLPVSSTGHLLLAGHFLGFESAGRTFEVVIQLGAILALFGSYTGRLARLVRGLGRDPQETKDFVAVLLAFLPSVFVGVLAHDFIKAVLFESPRLIATMLILGGIILILVDRMPLAPRYHASHEMPLRVAVTIGLAQCLAMVPGVSRSGATIVAGMLYGADKRTAAEFSFFLSMPTMAAAVTFDLWKSRHELDLGAIGDISLGFVAATVTAWLVVHWLLGYVTRHGYALFGWWRIAAGLAVWAALLAGF